MTTGDTSGHLGTPEILLLVLPTFEEMKMTLTKPGEHIFYSFSKMNLQNITFNVSKML